MPEPSIKAAVLGSPIAHSKSPLLHVAGYAALGLHEWTYDRAKLTGEDFVPWLLERGTGYRGLSVTMPLKTHALEAAVWADDLARLTGAANTLVFEHPAVDASAFAWNTDIHGIVTALREAGTVSAPCVDVLGAGASCASALAALTAFDTHTVRIVARDEHRSRPKVELAERLGFAASFVPLERWGSADGAELVVSTLPVSASEQLTPSEELVAESALFDVVYAPWPSPLARRWFAAERRVVSGEAMLLHQAVEQLRLMTTFRSREEREAWGFPAVTWDSATVTRVTEALRRALVTA